MTLLKLLEEGHFYEIQRSPGHRDDLEDQAVSYAGPCVPITIRTWCFCEPTLWIPEAKFMNFVWKMSFLPKNSPVSVNLTELPSNKLESGSGGGVRQCV